MKRGVNGDVWLGLFARTDQSIIAQVKWNMFVCCCMLVRYITITLAHCNDYDHTEYVLTLAIKDTTGKKNTLDVPKRIAFYTPQPPDREIHFNQIYTACVRVLIIQADIDDLQTTCILLTTLRLMLN